MASDVGNDDGYKKSRFSKFPTTMNGGCLDKKLIVVS